MKNQNHIPPSRRVPTMVDIWARGLDVDVTLFDDRTVLDAIESANVQQVINVCLEKAKKNNDLESQAAFSNFMCKLELVSVIANYYSKKPTSTTRRFGQLDRDQISSNHPEYYGKTIR